MIELRTLGTFTAVDRSDGQSRRLVLAPRQMALLVRLVLARPREPVSRDRLLGIFWSDASQERARTALRQAL